jgi:hypothetical protein
MAVLATGCRLGAGSQDVDESGSPLLGAEQFAEQVFGWRGLERDLHGVPLMTTNY